jgi:hypothetical protein
MTAIVHSRVTLGGKVYTKTEMPGVPAGTFTPGHELTEAQKRMVEAEFERINAALIAKYAPGT